MIGRTVGQYEIQEQLGSGGMGIVYKALDTRLHRTVALKFLPPHLNADESAKERFMQEARAASALDHANICTIYEVGEAEDGQIFIAMAFYEGQTLKYILDERSVEPSEAVLIAHQIAAGLSRAHEAEIVHRDIKPANIMLTNRGEVKILDFGVAKLSESADLTKVGSTIGTAAYMSPEQARGEKVDTRADIWSIGVLLYEMLAGERPFGGTYEAAFIYAIMNEEPGPIKATLPDGLADIVSKCLKKQADERYQHCADLTVALDPFLSPSGARHAAATTIASSLPAQVPSPGRITGAYTLIAALVLGFIYAVMMGFGLPDWVFQASVALMLLGLPVLLFAAHSERNSSGPSWLTFKRAVWGGVISISGLSLVTAGFMIMRVMGIGPAATLQSAGILEENAKLLVAEFDNQTQDETLGSSVTELLKIDLSQSGAISLMDGSDIVAVLSRMNLSPDTPIDLNTAMEIAAREGAEAVIAGEIRQIGAGFSISARLLSAIDGSELEAFRMTADDDTRIISAIDRLSGNVREQIGESIKTIRANEDLDRVTTSSLDALRLYSQGVAAEDGGHHDRSIELLSQAVELDSSFAMAYRKLAVVYGNSDASPEFAIAAATKAYQLRNRLPEREKGLSTAYYYSVVDRDRDQSVAAYEAILENYPDDTPALNNVSLEYLVRGEFAKAERNLRHAIELSDRSVFYLNLLNSLSAQKKWDEADVYMARFIESNPTHPSQASMAFKLAVARGNYQDADTLIGAASFNNDPFWQIEDAGNRADYHIYRGQLRAVEAQVLKANALTEERGVLSTVLNWSLDDAHIRIDLLGDLDGARRIMEDALVRVPLDSLSVEARPYVKLISLHAKMGEVERARALRDEYERLVPGRLRKGNLGRFQADAEILLAEGLLVEALETMQLSQSVDRCHICFYDRQAMVLERLDSLEAAVQLLEEFADYSMSGSFWYLAPKIPLVLSRLGELHSRLGNTESAIEAYTNFVNLWKEADDELQPRVQYARDQIEHLLDQSLREPQ
ncbi:MAG: hypothetical protein BMS9Abin05_1660 [Rhodothermia bacterium]|nr:MAG: hypothetical protein BMS9Abin05_1660 [Rhodothermia bacterium]